MDIDSVYRYLVPDFLKAELRNVGVMGGVSADVRIIPIPPPPSPSLLERGEMGCRLIHNSIIHSQVYRLSSYTHVALRKLWRPLALS